MLLSVQFLSHFLAKKVSKTEQGLIRVSPMDNFDKITASFVGIGLKNTQKSMKQQKIMLFDRLIPIFVQTRKVFEEWKFH